MEEDDGSNLAKDKKTRSKRSVILEYFRKLHLSKSCYDVPREESFSTIVDHWNVDGDRPLSGSGYSQFCINLHPKDTCGQQNE